MSVNVSASAMISQIRAKLIEIFAAEMNVGPAGAGTGTNTTGRLQTVLGGPHRSVSIGPLYPAIGVQFKKINFDFSGSSRFDFTAEYLLLVGVEAAIDPATSLVQLDQANDQLDKIVDDGSGNGIGPILLDPANYQLGGLANTTLISEWVYAWQDPTQTDSAPLAYAAATYRVSRQVARR